MLKDCGDVGFYLASPQFFFVGLAVCKPLKWNNVTSLGANVLARMINTRGSG